MNIESESSHTFSNENVPFHSSYPTEGAEFEFSETTSIISPDKLIEQMERRQLTTEILDTSGKQVCNIDYDPDTGSIISISPSLYVNPEATAENLQENIYITNEKGCITSERLTRGEAREDGKRYLIVTTIIFHDNQILTQERSDQKKFDPGKVSTSAHGVAKELFMPGEKRIEDGQTAATINAALEINEELRHGINPFKFRVWPGRHDELVNYAEEKSINDPDTLWLIPEIYLSDDRYPLNRGSENHRTRALLSGFIFCEGAPTIVPDPGEVKKTRWQKDSELFKDPLASSDLSPSSLVVIEKILDDNPWVKKYGPGIKEAMIKRMLGLPPKERP